MTMKKIEPQFDPAWFTPEGWEEGIELAFCPTGEGGGIDNSCSSSGSDSAALIARRNEVRAEIARIKKSDNKSGLARLRKERAKLNKQIAEAAGIAVPTERDTRSRLEKDIDKIKFKEGGRASKNTWKITSTGGSAEYAFKTESGRKFTVKAGRNFGYREPGATNLPVKSINIIFTDENESTMRTGRGEAFTVFRNVTPAVAAIVRRDRPEKVSFSASGQSRVDLYTKLTKTVLKLTPGHRAFKQGSGGYAYFNIYREDAVPANLDTIEYQEIKLAEGIEMMGWEELDPEIDPLWFVEEGWDEELLDELGIELAFCPTGEGGGVDNSCSSRVSGGGKGVVASKSPKPGETSKDQDYWVVDRDDIGISKSARDTLRRVLDNPDANADDAIRMAGITEDLINGLQEYEDFDFTLEVSTEEGPDGEETVMVLLRSEQISMDRVFAKQSDGRLVCTNDQLFIREDLQGQGIGGRIFEAQVAELSARGFDHIETFADGEDGSDTVGYKVWPLLGYDCDLAGPLTAEQGKEVKQKFGAKTLQELYRTEEGRSWWRRNGSGTFMTFDLKEGSKSMKILNAYKEAKRRKAA